jgi:hypothetical protein
MPEISSDVIALIDFLVPGFVVAWIYFGMTSHRASSQFERIVQALIYTAMVRVLVAAEKALAFRLGEWRSLGTWTLQSELVASLLTALGLGIIAATAVNHDVVHGALRRVRMTKRTGHPCEWFGIFSDHPRFITLQLKDASRVHGWPAVWPETAAHGHFFITNALREVAGTQQDLSHLEGLLVSAAEVAYVEFHPMPRKA